MSGELPGSERLIVVVGPSGAGKDSVISGWLASLPPALRPQRARRSITRAADRHEEHEPMQPGAFGAAAAAGAFAFAWQAHGLHYGVRHAELGPLATGGWVVMNGSRDHLPQLLARAPRAHVVEIDAPAAVRAARLRGRERETHDQRLARLARSVRCPGCELRIENAGHLADAVGALDAWWQDVRELQNMA